jgi:hypothetical protein
MVMTAAQRMRFSLERHFGELDLSWHEQIENALRRHQGGRLSRMRQHQGQKPLATPARLIFRVTPEQHLEAD